MTLPDLRDGEAKRLREHKNILLGLVGGLRDARPGDVADNHFRARQEDPRHRFLVGLRHALVNVHNELPQSSFEDYFAWLKVQLLGASFNEFPAPIKALDGLFDARPLPAFAELKFVAYRIGPYLRQLAVFENFRHRLAAAVLCGDAAEARKILEILGTTFGASLWLFELGLAVGQTFDGLEAQKRYSERVRAPLKRSIYAYLVRQASVRNEPSTTWPRFREDVSRRISVFGFDEAKTIYLRYRLFGEPFAGAGEALATLATAQSYPVIDLYMTARDVAGWTLARQQDEPLRAAVLEWFSPIEEAVRRIATDDGAKLLDRPSSISKAVNALADGRLQLAYRLARRELKAGSVSAPMMAVLAICYAEASRSPDQLDGPLRWLIDDLRVIALGGANWQISTSSARKLTQNFRGLPIFDEIRRLVDFLANPTLNGAPELLHCLFGLLPAASLRCSTGNPSPFENFVEAVRAISIDDLETAADHLRAALGKGSAVADRLANILLIHIAVNDGSTIDAARLLAREASRAPQAADSLPTEVVLPNPRWADFKPHAAELFPAIVMDLRWKASRDDRAASVRRFAFNEVLRLQGVTRPTQLEAHLDRFDSAELIYFLRNVCVSNVMDMSSFFSTLSDVEEEIINIQFWLTRLDPENRHEYDARRVDLTNNRAIYEGMRIIDSSRIHVDIEAITAWARKEIAEYFARYVGLVGAGIGIADDLASVLKQVTAPDAISSLEPPSSEADTILIEQTRRLQDQFLHNPEHGLDSYLSRRVRHHPLTATLRSPVEFANLITTRVTEFGAYRENTYWLERLAVLTEDQRAATASAFENFAHEFDQILTDLKDERFHVRTLEKPNGLFDADIGPLHHHLLRAIVQLDLSLETYLAEALGIFSARLEYSLEEAREYLNGEVKQRVAECFDKLRAKLHSAESSPAYSELATVCGDAAAEVQRKLFEVSEWLTREEGLALSKTFSLHQVLEIGIRSALDPHKEYQPVIEVEVAAEDMEMPATNIAFISEFLLVILNNARLHGDVIVGQKVKIRCAVDIEAQTLTLRVDSNFGPAARSSAKDKKVRELHAAIHSGKFDRSRVRREGNSGFVKIASIVSQSKDGRLDFGFNDDDMFFVEVVYSLFIFKKAEA
ncbi:hypothetical protein [Methylobacterium pseudosasicola]|uniref:Uncharacterized protein n=1 Tax=Methylobacterium pseudosasicola TaxID=582667 RepID=A0A1I4U7L4_9HYPH|nr:hypothetical protein [Methylobacterium pseudosasicola]SFM84947.1 hypothetical protein SAMN05192568_106419 [Methylobacterium pseudosasicola]